MKLRLDQYTNPEYKPGKNALIRFFWYYINAIVFKSYWFPFNGLKSILLRIFGAKIGKNCIWKPGVNIKYPWKLQVGNYSWIGEKVWIDNLDQVIIGDHVCISQGAMLLCGNHNYNAVKFDLITKSIIVESGSWIGAMSIVCPGARIKSHAVLSVGSVAIGELEAYYIYQGNPASKKKKRIINE